MSSMLFFLYFCLPNNVIKSMEQTKWSETVILTDAGYVDAVVFNLTVNFERMLNRPIPRADLAQWLVCVALDGGVEPGDNDIQAVLVHKKDKKALDNFIPSDFSSDLDGKAFNDGKLGEFRISSVQIENLVDADELFVQSLEALSAAKEIKRLIVIPDMEIYGARVREVLGRTEGKDVTLLAMEPQAGRGFRQDILGYSLMSALGIRGEEFK